MSRFNLIIALSFFALSFHFAHSHTSAQPTQNSANQQQDKPDQNPQPSPTNSVLQVDHPPSESPEAGPANNDRQPDKQITFDLVSQLPAWIQTGIAILLFVWVIRQTKISNQQREIMQKQIEMSETIERGFIGIGDIQLTNLVAGHCPTVTIKWINGGRTPVQNFRANPTLYFAKEPSPKNLGRIDDDVSPISASFFPVGAERQVPYEQTQPISEADLDAFEKGSLNIYIVGNFIYRDMSGHTRSGGIEAMRDAFDEFVYETYEHTSAEQSLKLVKPT